MSDRTLVKANIDSTTPAVTQTNATCNHAMFDFEDVFRYQPKSIDINPSTGTKAEWLAKATDKKVSAMSDAKYQNQSPVIDFGELITTGTICMIWFGSWIAGGALNLYTSVDGSTWSSSIYSHGANVDYVTAKLSPHTFRYLKISVNNNYAIYIRELFAYT